MDLLRLSESNYMKDIYEMLGIYQEYLQSADINDEFSTYYEAYAGTTEYHFIESLPITGAGKIDFRTLEKWATEGE